MSSSAGATIVAAAQATYSKRSYASPRELLVQLGADLATQTGLAPGDIDGLAVTSFGLAPDNVTTIAEQLGIQVNWSWQGAQGGASGVISVIQAAHAVSRGEASAILCLAADSFDVASHMAMLSRFNTGMHEFLNPYGFGGTNGLFALVERRHRHLHGTAREHLGALACAQRRYAGCNDNALLRSPMSMEEFLSARLIADPLRLYDCVLPCTGADGVLVVASHLAEQLGGAAVRLRSSGERHNHRPREVLSMQTGARAYAAQLFREAGCAPTDMDLIQLYDDYPIMVAIQLEDYGFAAEGQGGWYLKDTDGGAGAGPPINTGGGQLSCGQAGASGGMIGVVEAVEQLLGQAGERQVQEAQLALVGGFGMVGYGRGLSSSAMILERVS